MGVELKRVYEDPKPDDGYRVLVDRLWPRGLSKSDAKLDEWAKSVSPSDDLRKWFHRNRSEWGEFRKRYIAELKGHKEDLSALVRQARKGRVTLLFSSTDAERNNAVVLREYLRRLGG